MSFNVGDRVTARGRAPEATIQYVWNDGEVTLYIIRLDGAEYDHEYLWREDQLQAVPRPLTAEDLRNFYEEQVFHISQKEFWEVLVQHLKKNGLA